MVEEIYDSIGNTYPDIRQYKNEREILQRRLEIQRILRALPRSQRKTRRQRQLQRESLLLKYKYMLYIDSADLPVEHLRTTRFLVESTDRMTGGEEDDVETPSQSERFKRYQTIAMIHLIHLKSTDDEFMSFYRKAMNIK